MRLTVTLLTLAALASGLCSGCIEARRMTGSDLETTPDEDADTDLIEDSTSSDTSDSDTNDATANDTNSNDTTSNDTNDATGPSCLPAGCVEPDATCALAPGSCWIDGACVADGDRDPENSCRHCDATASPRAWKTLPDASGCDDGLDCTKDDICRQGSCRGESTCTSSLSCLTPICDAVENACVDTIDPGRCFFRDACYSEGQPLAGHCARCEPSTSQIEPTPGDRHEPDDSLEQANPLAFNDALVTTGLNADPAWNGPWTTSTLSPLLDIDAFAFVFMSSAGFTRPVVKVDQASSLPLEVCVYIRCLPEEGESTRPISNATCAGTDTKKSVDGWVGCCRNGNSLTSEYIPSQAWCERSGTKVVTRTEAGATIRRTTPPAAPDCHSYTLRWGMR